MSPPPLPPRLARGSLPPFPAEPELGKLRHGGRRGVTAGHGLAALIS